MVKIIADKIKTAIQMDEEKGWKIESALEVDVGVEEEDDDGVEEDDGVEDAETVLILTFIPWSQCPIVPQAKYRVPGLSSLTTLFPPFMESTALPMPQLLYALSSPSSTTLCIVEYLKTSLSPTLNVSLDAHELKSVDSSQLELPPTVWSVADTASL